MSSGFPTRSDTNQAVQPQKMARGLEFRIEKEEELYYLLSHFAYAKTKTLISFAVTAKLICVFVFAYAKCWFSHDAAHIKVSIYVRSFMPQENEKLRLYVKVNFVCALKSG